MKDIFLLENVFSKQRMSSSSVRESKRVYGCDHVCTGVSVCCRSVCIERMCAFEG